MEHTLAHRLLSRPSSFSRSAAFALRSTVYSAVRSRRTPLGWKPILYGVPLARLDVELAADGAGDVDKPAAAASAAAPPALPVRACVLGAGPGGALATPAPLFRLSSSLLNVALVGDGDAATASTFAGGADSRPSRRKLAGGGGRFAPLPFATCPVLCARVDCIESRRATRGANGKLSGGGLDAKLPDRLCGCPCRAMTPLISCPTVDATVATPLSVLLRNSRPRPSPRGASAESHCCARSAAATAAPPPPAVAEEARARCGCGAASAGPPPVEAEAEGAPEMEDEAVWDSTNALELVVGGEPMAGPVDPAPVPPARLEILAVEVGRGRVVAEPKVRRGGVPPGASWAMVSEWRSA